MDDENVLDKIKTRGYWRINVRPLKYQKNIVDSINDLHEIIEKCQIRYRGWPYPLIKESYSGNDYIWGMVNWQNHIEYWRFYQSLQFLHFFAMREDWEDKVEHFFGGKISNPRKPFSGLSVLSSLYSFIEIYEFISRLIKYPPYEIGLKIKIDLIGVKDRKLFFHDPIRHLDADYNAKIQKIIFEKEYLFEDLVSNLHQNTLECCIHFFERFNWKKINRNFLESELNKFLGKKKSQ